MKKSIVFLAVIMLLALTAVSAFANYASVSGVVHDSKTNSPWIYGGTVTVFNCSDASQAALGTSPVTIAVDGTFSVTGLSGDPSVFRALCVEFDYSTATSPNGPPPNKLTAVIDEAVNTGDYDMGIIYTDTGPTAVNLLNINVAQTQPIQLVGITIMLLGLVFTGIIVWRRKTQS